jgi:hypothetical protein
MKYNVGDKVEVVGTKKQLIVEDMEQFDSLNLYYTSDKSAYPEPQLKPVGFQVLKNLFTLSNDEKNKQFDEAWGNFSF